MDSPTAWRSLKGVGLWCAYFLGCLSCLMLAMVGAMAAHPESGPHSKHVGAALSLGTLTAALGECVFWECVARRRGTATANAMRGTPTRDYCMLLVLIACWVTVFCWSRDHGPASTWPLVCAIAAACATSTSVGTQA
jgi:predicted membrane channel-forming protein YqfA (hemolysin III family)